MLGILLKGQNRSPHASSLGATGFVLNLVHVRRKAKGPSRKLYHEVESEGSVSGLYLGCVSEVCSQGLFLGSVSEVCIRGLFLKRLARR